MRKPRPIICSMRLILYHGSRIWTCRTFLKSTPSEISGDPIITRISDPFAFSGLRRRRISCATCRSPISEVRNAYFPFGDPSYSPEGFSRSLVPIAGSYPCSSSAIANWRAPPRTKLENTNEIPGAASMHLRTVWNFAAWALIFDGERKGITFLAYRY